MRLRKNSQLLLCVYVLLFLAGCGYTTKAMLPSDIKSIHIDIFKNNIDIAKEVSAKDKYRVYRPGLEVDIRDAIVERIFLDGHLKLKSRNRADSILEGEIIEYRKDPLRYQDEDVTEYEISLVCNVSLKDSKNSEYLLKEENIIGDTTYFTTGSLQESETAAIDSAASDLAREIVNKIIENW